MGCLPDKLPYKLTVATICQQHNWAPGPGLLTHSGLTSSWATEHLGNAMVALILYILALFARPSLICIMSPQSAAMVAMATMTAMALVPPLEVTWFCDIIVAARWTLATGLAGPFIAGEDNTESISSQGRWGSLPRAAPSCCSLCKSE